MITHTSTIRSLLALVALTGGLLMSCKTQQKSSAAAGGAWQKIFNGKDLSGWHTFQKQQVDPRWYVEKGGILTLDPAKNGGGDLVSDATFTNFVLELEWKISKAGNSGILFNVQETPAYKKTYFSGPEMQVLDNKEASDNKKDNHLAGSLYDLVACNPDYAKPVGDWNKVKIQQVDGKFTFWFNGHQVVEAQIGSTKWKNMVAGSKFSHYPSFGLATSGHIALQDHGHRVWYRNIRIKTL